MKQSEKNIADRRNKCRNLWLEGVAHLRKSMRAVKARAGRKWEPAKGYPALCYSLYNGQVKGGVSRPAAWILLFGKGMMREPRKPSQGPGKMAQQLRTHVVLPEDLRSIPVPTWWLTKV